MSQHSLNRRELLKGSIMGLIGFSALPSLAYSFDKPKPPSAQAFGSLSEAVYPEVFKEAPLRLLANENPYGPSQKARKAIVDSLDQGFMYPMKAIQNLRKVIADKEKVSEKQVMLTAGSSQVLLAAFLSYGQKGKVVVADPGYISNVKELDMIKVPLNAQYQHDLAAMEKKVSSEASLVYICNPNNPTGTIVNPDELRSFCERVSQKIPVMVDEAYIDYTDNPEENSMMTAVRKGQNVMVVRTFSKLHGLAGLRIGYCVAQEEVIEEFSKYCSRFDLCLTSAEAALASYDDEDFLKEVKANTLKSKQYVYDSLQEMGYEYVPSHSNFILFPLRMKGKSFLSKMYEEGVLVRSWEFNRQHWCRVSIGKAEDMRGFVKALKKVVG